VAGVLLRRMGTHIANEIERWRPVVKAAITSDLE
jgi:hypothetical protein